MFSGKSGSVVRRRTGLIFIGAGLLGILAALSAGGVFAGQPSGDPPTVESLRTTEAVAPAEQGSLATTPVAAGLTIADMARAEQIASDSPFLAKIADGVEVTVLHGQTVPVTPSSSPVGPNFKAALVFILFADEVHFPAGIPIMKSGPEEVGNGLPLDEATELSNDMGRKIQSLGVSIDLEHNEVIAFFPGMTPLEGR